MEGKRNFICVYHGCHTAVSPAKGITTDSVAVSLVISVHLFFNAKFIAEH